MKYVVLQKQEGGTWIEVAAVEAAPRARRSTMLLAADLKPGKDGGDYRVLDARSAHVYRVRSETHTKLVVD